MPQRITPAELEAALLELVGDWVETTAVVARDETASAAPEKEGS